MPSSTIWRVAVRCHSKRILSISFWWCSCSVLFNRLNMIEWSNIWWNISNQDEENCYFVIMASMICPSWGSRTINASRKTSTQDRMEHWRTSFSKVRLLSHNPLPFLKDNLSSLPASRWTWSIVHASWPTQRTESRWSTTASQSLETVENVSNLVTMQIRESWKRINHSLLFMFCWRIPRSLSSSSWDCQRIIMGQILPMSSSVKRHVRGLRARSYFRILHLIFSGVDYAW